MNSQVHKNLLTPREVQVLECVASGLSNKEIARKLQIKQDTVEIHIHNILQAFGVNNRTAAVIIALEHGYIALPHL
jgi:DNA-binding NarL/FixJ family response regulator